MKLKERRRLMLVSFFLLFLFSFIIVAFYHLQIVEGEKWDKRARMQHHFTANNTAKRGRFLAHYSLKEDHLNKEVLLVGNVKRYHFYADPLLIPSLLVPELTDRLGELLVLNWEEKDQLMKNLLMKSHSRKLRKWLTEKEKEHIKSWWISYAKWKKLPSNALYFMEDYRRFYPYGKLLGTVLHTVRDERDPQTNRLFPTGGLELYFDALLTGKSGKRLQLRSPKHSLEQGIILSKPEDGADIYLTIEPFIQAIAEEEIKKGVKSAGAKRGWAVMMDPYTGEIIALAQFPSFNPSNYQTFYNDKEKIDATKVHAVIDCFEPGSTMKPISVAIAFLANEELIKQGKDPIFSPHEMIPTWDGSFPGRRPLREVTKHRYLNMYLGIQKSSNVYVARLIQRVVAALGEEWYQKQLSEVFGFGKKVGIELPGESEGLLPSPHETYYGSKRVLWSKPTPYSLAIGHNLLTTTFQMLKAYAIIANGGFDVKPTFIQKIVKGGEIIKATRTHKKEKVSLLKPYIVKELVVALKLVTKGYLGRRADILGYTEAGKSGTSEKVVKGVYCRKTHFSSFIGFAPANCPRFVLAIAIDEPEHRYLPGIGKTYFGGHCAAPVFQKIMQRTFKYLAIPPDDPFGYRKNDPRFDPEKADGVQELEILRKLYGKWNAA